MNKAILLFLLFISCSVFCYAQTMPGNSQQESKLSIGLYGGVNLSKAYNFFPTPYISPYGPNTGIIFQIKLSKKVFISTGLAFNQYRKYFGIAVNALPWYDSPSPYTFTHPKPFFYFYALPAYFTLQSSKEQKLKIRASLGAEEIFWADKYSFIKNENLQLKTFFGIKLGLAFKLSSRLSVFSDAGAKKNIHIYKSSDKYGSTTSADVNVVFDFNLGILCHF